MSADPVVYCLQELTDYVQLERLCADIMNMSGYAGIEPIGGAKDKGRDALHRAVVDGKTSIFAFSAREDWRKKLESDAAKVKDHGHACDRFVFVCTSPFTANERDKACDFVKAQFGWDLDLYGIERLAMLLRTTCERVVANHQGIFSPPWFPSAGGLSLALSNDHVVIDHVDDDTPFAQWLARRLLLEGYRVWCRGLAPLAGTSVADSVREVIRQRAHRVITVLSPAAARDANISARRTTAHEVGRLRKEAIVIPAYIKDFNIDGIDADTKALAPADFRGSWAAGLRTVLASLAASACPRAEKASGAAAASYMTESLVVMEPEPLYSNAFRIQRIPEEFLVTELDKDVPTDFRDLEQAWGYRYLGPKRVISFLPAPREVRQAFGVSTVKHVPRERDGSVEGVRVFDLTKELLRATVQAAFLQRKLRCCRENGDIYFPQGLLGNEALSVNAVDGDKTWFSVVGERTYRNGSKFRYHLAPVVSVKSRPQAGPELLLRIRLHLTELDGSKLDTKKIPSRRKALCANWWNDKWLIRTLGMMQFLADGGESVVLGEHPNQVVIDTWPRAWQAPARLKEEAIDVATAELQEEQSDRHDDDDDDDVDSSYGTSSTSQASGS